MAWIDVTGPSFWSILRSATWSGSDLVYDGSANDIPLQVAGAWAEKLRPSRFRITYTCSNTASSAYGSWYAKGKVPYLAGQDNSGFIAGANAHVLECNLGWYGSLEYLTIPQPNAAHTLTVSKIEYEIDDSIYDYLDYYTVQDYAYLTYEYTPVARYEYANTAVSQYLNFRTGAEYDHVWDDTANQPNNLRVIIELASDDAVDRRFKLIYDVDAYSDVTIIEETHTLTAGINVFNFAFNKPPAGKKFTHLQMISADGSTPLNAFHLTTLAFSYIEPPATEKAFAVDRYELKMTGTPELVLPMSNFSARLISAAPSYLQAVVPGGADYIDEINARALEDLVVSWKSVDSDTGEVLDSAEIITVNFENMTVARGANRRSLTLTGHKQKTYSTPKAVELDGHYIENGLTDVFTFNPSVYPKDTFNSKTISTMTININTNGTSMALTYE